MFWPSLLMTGDMWAAQADHFGDRRRVILVDPPGHGRSEKLTAMFDFDDCARCIVDILDALGEQRTHFVGNSWGGMIGGTFAATYPDRIGSAVLMNCTASPAGTRQKIEYGFLLRMAKLLGGVRPPLTRSVLKAFLGPTTFSTRPDVVAFVRDTVQAVDIGSGPGRCRAWCPPGRTSVRCSRKSRHRYWSSREPRTRRSRCPRPSQWPRRYPVRPSRCSKASHTWPGWRTRHWSIS